LEYEFVYDILDKLPALIDMQKIEPPKVVKWIDEWNKTGTPGISGYVMITTSHISIHTFPDEDYVFIDVFSCKGFDVEKAKEFLISAFEAQDADVNIVRRGLKFRKSTVPVLN